MPEEREDHLWEVLWARPGIGAITSDRSGCQHYWVLVMPSCRLLEGHLLTVYSCGGGLGNLSLPFPIRPQSYQIRVLLYVLI